ncbi:Zn-dependent dipeptidase, microsomal dipeptidase [Paludisphaera sp.]|uniref:Zn-dependent dipeptidase, microsomal dipeptidase n=1 Tax=Paludisphaera sp. TaxID=2017432 RepID=UPI00301CE174
MRLIDLRCDWALQYAAESTQYDPADYPEIPARVGRLDGYLTGATAAVVSCRRAPDDWARRADPWRDLGEMIARHEAEFSGRLLAGPEDAERWRAEPRGGLCWGVLAVVGLEALIKSPADLDRLAPLFARGARVFGAVPGDLSRPFLERLLELAPEGEGPRPALDVADADAATVAAALDWYEAEPTRASRLPLLHSAVGPDAATDIVRRLRALGATLGVAPTPTAEEFRATIESLAALPFRDRPGYEGIGVATDYLRLDRTAPELSKVGRLAAWIAEHLPKDAARAVAFENARRFLLAIAGR